MKLFKRRREPEPLPVEWEETRDYCDGHKVGEMPICPKCKEPAFSLDGNGRCDFCGQPIEMDRRLREYYEPAPEETMDCLFCGGADTMVFVRSKYNGHKHGHCTKCGARFMEEDDDDGFLRLS